MQARGEVKINSQHREEQVRPTLSLERTTTPMNTDNAVADPVATQYADSLIERINHVREPLIERINQLEQQNAEATAQRDAAIAERDHAQANAIRTVAPWHVEEVGNGQFTYTLTVPATVSVTTDIDLREVYDYGIGGVDHRYFWYRSSEDDQYHELPMHLESVESEPEADQGTWLNMYDNADDSTVFDGGLVEMTYGEGYLSAVLRDELGDGEEY
jgi:hypothetical protein